MGGRKKTLGRRRDGGASQIPSARGAGHAAGAAAARDSIAAGVAAGHLQVPSLQQSGFAGSGFAVSALTVSAFEDESGCAARCSGQGAF